jgi:hypothetical protein
MKYRLFTLIFIGLVTILLLTSCTPWVETNQGSTGQMNSQNPGSFIGHIFVVEHSVVQAIHLLLKPQPPSGINLTAYLRSNPASITDLCIGQINGCEYFGLRDVPSNQVSIEGSSRLINHNKRVRILG